jgi:hypothetical protein
MTLFDTLNKVGFIQTFNKASFQEPTFIISSVGSTGDIISQIMLFSITKLIFLFRNKYEFIVNTHEIGTIFLCNLYLIYFSDNHRFIF